MSSFLQKLQTRRSLILRLHALEFTMKAKSSHLKQLIHIFILLSLPSPLFNIYTALNFLSSPRAF